MPMLNVLRNCREATLLLEKREARPLSLAERLRLGAHLLYCVYCRRYAQQTRLIGQAAKRAAGAVGNAALSAAGKERLRAALRQRGVGE